MASYVINGLKLAFLHEVNNSYIPYCLNAAQQTAEKCIYWMKFGHVAHSVIKNKNFRGLRQKSRTKLCVPYHNYVMNTICLEGICRVTTQEMQGSTKPAVKVTRIPILSQCQQT